MGLALYGVLRGEKQWLDGPLLREEKRVNVTFSFGLVLTWLIVAAVAHRSGMFPELFNRAWVNILTIQFNGFIINTSHERISFH